MKKINTKNQNLEIVRGLAALLVFLCHIIGKIEIPFFQETFIFNLIGNWGTESVIIFFILSGIVIGISQSRNEKSTIQFLKNRLTRIFPIYIIGIILAVLANLLIRGTSPDNSTILGSLFFLSSLQNWITMPLEYNPVIWSLSFEMFFYLVFAFTIGKYQKILIFIWLIVSILAIPYYYSTTITNGILKHFIAMFSFSSIWLIGYYIQQYNWFVKFGIFNALFSLFTLPLVSRLNITPLYYDVIKYFIFSITSIPFFCYILNPANKVNNKAILIQVITYILFIVLLFRYSQSLYVSKIVYSVLPIFSVIYISFNIFSILIKKFKNLLILLGEISYSLYILHYPSYL